MQGEADVRRFAWAGIVLAGSLAIGALSYGQAPSVCKKTVVGQKCGTDIVLSWVQCEDPPLQCNTEEEVYGLVYSCDGAGNGKTSCMDQPCNKRVIVRACVNNECVFQSDTPTLVVTGQSATGENCPSLPP